MTDITLEQRARELLAAEYKSFGFTRGAEALLAGRSDTFDKCALRAVEAALRLSAGADWVLVPREPTEAMLKAGKIADDYAYGGHRNATRIYRAMLAAAPRHEPGEGL